MILTKPNELLVRQFTEESAENFCQKLKEFSQVPENPIIVNIDSYGGNVDSLLKMLECMDSIDNTIITHCSGKAMSCGAVLLSHGDLRFVGKYSRILIHQVWTMLFGNVDVLKVGLKETEKLNKITSNNNFI